MTSENDAFRQCLVDGRQDAQASYDKALLSLSGGALGISLVFLKDVAGPQPVATWLVAVGWLPLVASLLMVVRSFRSSARAFDQAIRRYDKGEGKGSLAYRWDDAAMQTERLNWWAGFLLGLGLVLLLAFAFVNLGR